MRYGFVKVCAATPKIRVADVDYNTRNIIAAISESAKKGSMLTVFPELSVCGYTCGDLLLSQTLLDGCLAALEEIAGATTELKMLVFVGLPIAYEGKLYNCAAAVANGRVLGFVPKTHIPSYGEFYEARYFSPAPEEEGAVRVGGGYARFARDLLIRDARHPEIAVACEICEDLWAPESPSTRHALSGAVIIANLSASNETVGKREYRKTLLSAQSGKTLSAYIYADAGMGESVSDTVYAGNDLIYENGVLLSEAPPFSGQIAEAEIDAEYLLNERRRTNTFAAENGDYAEESAFFIGDGDLTLRKIPQLPFVPQGKELERRCGLILSIQSSALARRLQHAHAKTAVIGVSGGLDSALALLVAARAFDLLGRSRGNIIAVTMPGFGTSLKTRNNANSLMQAVGATVRTVNIAGTVNRHFRDIDHDPEERNVTYENAQARYRTMVLMDIANETQGLVVGTGDLSELALGWCTYNGDHMSMYAVNSSVPKTLVKSLVQYEAMRVGGRMEVVLKSILNTEISPELLPPDEGGDISQKTEDIVGPYELHDFYLFCFLRRGYSPAKTLYLAERAFEGKYERATLKKWLVSFYKRFFAQQFKRNCVPDGVKVGSVSLSPRADWRMPSDASGALWITQAENL